MENTRVIVFKVSVHRHLFYYFHPEVPSISSIEPLHFYRFHPLFTLTLTVNFPLFEPAQIVLYFPNQRRLIKTMTRKISHNIHLIILWLNSDSASEPWSYWIYASGQPQPSELPRETTVSSCKCLSLILTICPYSCTTGHGVSLSLLHQLNTNLVACWSSCFAWAESLTGLRGQAIL